MRRLPVVLGLLALCSALFVGGGYGQDKQKETQPPKVQLPKGWGKIGITPDQKQKIYDVLSNYQTKITALENQLEKLKDERMAEAYKLLNDDQKAALKKAADKAFDKDKDKDKSFGKDKSFDKDKDKSFDKDKAFDKDKDKDKKKG